jgi:predicted ATPase/DNA-binding XRE family transcriptional regulator
MEPGRAATNGGTASFGEVLRRLRSAAALSQEDLAERAGLSRNGISDLERGARLVPRLETVRLLADALEIGQDDRAALLAAARPTLRVVDASGSVPSAPSALPTPLTRLIGRETEVAALQDRLQDADVRLLTLTGPGGVGKTRLAIAVANRLRDTFPDGVVFVDLSPLTDPELVGPVMAAALGVRESAGQYLSETLATFLASKQLLIILDNCERVLAAAFDVTALLAASAGLTVLTTSREPFHVRGEREFPVSPLPLPAADQLPPIDELANVPAVALFVERAMAGQPDFALREENAVPIAAICRRLDGLPLAIELAAARVKILPPAALLARLEHRLPLLTGGGRDLPERQRTMHDAIAWSHDLLSPEEQTLWRRLAVFAGGFTIDAAEAVAGPEGNLDVYAGLASLVDKSLVRQAEGAESDPRFRMLETMREYGQERLELSGEAEETRRRLADWCLSLAEEARPDVAAGTIEPRWMIRLHEEVPNLQDAVTWLLDRGEATKVLRLLAATEDFWTKQHRAAELRRWLETALTAAPGAPATDRAVALWLLTLMNGVRGHGQTAEVHAQQMLVAAQASGEPRLLGLAQYAVGLACDFRGDLDRAAAAYAEAIPFFRAAGSEDFVWIAQADLADKLVLHGDLEAGVPMLDEALTRLRPISADCADWFVVLVIAQRGHAALRQGDLPGATRWFTESIDAAQNHQETRTALTGVTGLAGVALALGQWERAARLLGAVEAAREVLGVGHVHGVHHAERIRTEVRAVLEATAFERAWVAGRALPLDGAVAEALAVANEVVTGAKC